MAGQRAWPCVFLLLLAGCLDEDVDPGVVSEERASSAYYDLVDCTMPVVIFLVDRERAQSLLPEPFIALDARVAFMALGLPTPPFVATGQGVVFYNALHCRSSSVSDQAVNFSDNGVLVEPPNIDASYRAPGNVVDYYQFVLPASPDPEWHAILAPGFRPDELPALAMDSFYEAPPEGEGTGSLRLHVDGAEWAAAIYASLGPPGWAATVDITMRAWHVADAGTFYFEIPLSDRMALASILGCSHPPGSHTAWLTGTEDCREARVMGLVADAWTAHGRFTWLPGVFPQRVP
jgi:hypothetical protein